MTEENHRPKPIRVLPQSELDLSLMTTDPKWGEETINPELLAYLNKYYVSKNEQGKEVITIQSLWSMLSFYTRDVRLGNLSYAWGEIQYCQYYLDLAHDLLNAGMIQAFMTALSKAVTVLEISQSKSGFLRRRMHTITQESSHQELEPPKKSLFGKQKKEMR